MRVVILAGGKGSRLRPFTTLVPKPLMPIGGKYSILEIIIMQLSRSGFTHITLAVNHLSHLIMSYFGDGSKWGIKLDYSVEDSSLSTIGPLTLITDLPDDFLVMNGDILSDLDYSFFLKKHIQDQAKVSVSAYKRTVKIDFGVLSFDKENLLTSFQEKPVYEFNVSMGIYAINKSIILKLTKGSLYGFDHLMIDALKNSMDINIVPYEGFWLDIGRPDDYDEANNSFSTIEEKLKIN
jgi:NDP-sugar pyrophosphorylase family protein